MARKNRHHLRDVAPELFNPAPPLWEPGQWDAIPIDFATSLEPIELESELEEHLTQYSDGVSFPEDVVADDSGAVWDSRLRARVANGQHLPGHLGERPGRPGAPWYQFGSYPTPDAFAFYLPFHRYPESCWGIYITPEGVLFYAAELARRTRTLSYAQCRVVARLFLYYHEFFHHVVESFATRLEVDRRQPLYSGPFEQLYRAQWKAGDVDEEALANGYALQRVKKTLAGKWSKVARREVVEALIDIVARMSFGYERGADLVAELAHVKARCDFAEKNYAEYDGSRTKHPAIWLSADNMFRGLENVKTQAWYFVPMGAHLSRRAHAGILSGV
jgi:hypothetical protein